MECLSSYLCNQALLDHIKDNCENPMFSGMDARAVIFSFSDIDRTKVVLDSDNSHIIKDLGIKKAKFIINARTTPFTGTNTTVEVGDYKNTFTRTVSLFVPMDGAAASKAVLDPLANGKFVVILKNDFVNDVKDNEYQVYGFDKGLVVSSMTQTKYENNDYWVVELQETGVMTSGKFLMYEGMENVTDVDFQLTYVETDGVGQYSGEFTKDGKSYSWSDVTGKEFIDDLSAPVANPTDNENWIQVGGQVLNARYTYPNPIVIDGDTYTLTIPGQAVEFENTANGDWMWKDMTTADYICNLIKTN